jgi:hypothetical protein
MKLKIAGWQFAEVRVIGYTHADLADWGGDWRRWHRWRRYGRCWCSRGRTAIYHRKCVINKNNACNLVRVSSSIKTRNYSTE